MKNINLDKILTEVILPKGDTSKDAKISRGKLWYYHNTNTIMSYIEIYKFINKCKIWAIKSNNSISSFLVNEKEWKVVVANHQKHSEEQTKVFSGDDEAELVLEATSWVINYKKDIK